MLARFSCLALAIGLISVAGCGPAKLDVTKNWTLDEPKMVLLDAQPKPQTIKVDFEADNPVIVLVVKDSDLAKDDDGGFTPANKALAASKAGEKKGEFSADLPANTAARVVARTSGGKATIKLHVTNQ